MPNDLPDWTVALTQLAGELTVQDLKVTGLAGAATVSRYVGAVSGAAPTSGTFSNGDYVVDTSTTSPGFWVCTVGGTPGTWVRSESLMPVPVTIAADNGLTGSLRLNNPSGATAGHNTGIDYLANAVAKWFQGMETAGDWMLFDNVAGARAVTITRNTDVAAWRGEQQAPDFAPSGLTGAVNASRYVGATAGGPPTSGTFAVGDFVVDRLWGIHWTCVTAGTPGTWRPSGPALISDQTVTNVASVRLPASGSLPTYFRRLLATYDQVRSAANANAVALTGPIFNDSGTGTTDYDNQNISAIAAALSSFSSVSGGAPRVGVIPAALSAAGLGASGEIRIEDYNVAQRHHWQAENARNDADAGVGSEVVTGNHHPGVAAALTSLAFLDVTPANINGTFRLWAY